MLQMMLELYGEGCCKPACLLLDFLKLCSSCQGVCRLCGERPFTSGHLRAGRAGLLGAATHQECVASAACRVLAYVQAQQRRQGISSHRERHGPS